MNLREAVISVLKDADGPLTSGEIADLVIERFPELHETPARLRSVEFGNSYSAKSALTAAINDFVGSDPRFDKDATVKPFRVSLKDISGPWSDDELTASVDAYLQMLRQLRAGTPFSKKEVYETLVARFGRTTKSFEYRMQNISYVMSLLGRQWLPGLKPARNVGANIAERIERLIADLEGREITPKVRFEIEARTETSLDRPPPAGSLQPQTTTSKSTTFVRDSSVKEWVMAKANGVCECCRQPAPFVGVDGPYLEVHHVRRLADFGADTVTNAVAICPNCHRHLHHGLDAPELVESLYARVPRLVRY